MLVFREIRVRKGNELRRRRFLVGDPLVTVSVHILHDLKGGSPMLQTDLGRARYQRSGRHSTYVSGRESFASTSSRRLAPGQVCSAALLPHVSDLVQQVEKQEYGS